jgi:hypothetical protein
MQTEVLTCNLNIIPILTRFKSHSAITFPLNAVDVGPAVTWIDDRIVDFVQRYFSTGEETSRVPETEQCRVEIETISRSVEQGRGLGGEQLCDAS